jgi:hypothetical protein
VRLPREDLLALEEVAEQVDARLVHRVLLALVGDQLDDLLAVPAHPLLRHVAVVGGVTLPHCQSASRQMATSGFAARGRW